jgi:rubrerythrin
MKRVTAQSMRDAFGVESASHMRYLIFSGKAAAEQFPNVARLFRALAASGKARATRHYEQASRLLGEYCVNFSTPFFLERTMDNITKAWEACKDAAEEFYPACTAVARSQNELHAAKEFEWFAQVEKNHSDMLRTVLGFIEHAAEEPKIGDLRVCDICGLVIEGKPPEDCPVCEAKSSFLISVE